MKPLQFIVIAVLIIVSFSFAPTAVYAGSSGWINANKLEKFNRRKLWRTNLPTSIKCKNNNAVTGMNRKNTMVKIQYRPNTDNTKYSWAWGTMVGPSHRILTKKGYKRVSLSSFRRPSGLLIKCAIWHKRR